MNLDRIAHGWSGSIKSFLSTPTSIIEEQLESHNFGLFNRGTSGSQIEAWLEEIKILRNSLRDLAIVRPGSIEWSVILEYELPLEGGRRPDVIILGPGIVTVLEFKQDSSLQQSQIDQVNAYARDLSEYHSKTHGIEVTPVLVPSKLTQLEMVKNGVQILSPDRIPFFLNSLKDEQPIDLHDWLSGDYAPLPTLIAAAKMIFNNEKLPAIKRAQSLGVQKAVDALRDVARSSRAEGKRSLAFVSGVPGAGKTLVGLQFVYAESGFNSQAIFLSGNGPLVEVLRDALKSKAFVSDLHAFIKTYGTTSKVPKQNVIVFDEAQRAWDADHMMNKKMIKESEPELLVRIAEKIPDWSTLVGLIGHGQEINTGEEAGVPGWYSALKDSSSGVEWSIYMPPRYSQEFPELDVTVLPDLDLTKTLRSRQAEDLHEWVQELLEGKLGKAAQIAERIKYQNFPIFITRDLDLAKEYVSNMYRGQQDKRYGLLASSKDKFLPSVGIENGFQETKLTKYPRWYNDPLGEKGSCCNLKDVVTEFGCQGLELDMALVAWGNDLLWDGRQWNIKKMRSRFPQKDPHQLRINSYRVLLTRSRDGLVIYVPEDSVFDQTEHALLAAGAQVLIENIDYAISS